MKKRLDVFLYKNGFVETRSKASQLIKGGYVFIDGKRCVKNGTSVDENSYVEVKSSPFVYVSRGGVKLKRAIDAFGINLKGKVCLDVGSSTGGFSDCMLKEGAKKIYAVDVGSNQLHEKLSSDFRIVAFENVDIRYFITDVKFDFIAADVSFISLKHILPHIKRLLKNSGESVVLIKPQFEVGPNIVTKGVVKDRKIIENVVNDIKNFCGAMDFYIEKVIDSPITGKEGNREYLMFLKKLM